MAVSRQAFLLLSASLALTHACAHLGSRTATIAGACVRNENERGIAKASAQFLADTVGSSWATGSRREWPFLGAAAAEVHVVTDDRVCFRVSRALRSSLGVRADSLVVAEVRGAYIAFSVPHENGTYVLDHELHLLDVLIVPS